MGADGDHVRTLRRRPLGESQFESRNSIEQATPSASRLERDKVREPTDPPVA